MNIALRLRLIAAACLGGAIWLGWQVAEGDYALPAIAATVAVLASLSRVWRVPVSAVILGLVFFGYLVGNRGFAQVMPLPQLPLLPAEIALLTAGGWAILQSAFDHRLPLRRDSLNLVLLLWMGAGTVRVLFDVRTHGLLAIRDYAMVYYALFFYLAQHIAHDAGARRFLLRIVIISSVAQPVAAVLTATFPQFFIEKLVFRGVPLILFKGDLALTFMAVSAFVLAFTLSGRFARWAQVLATAELIVVIGGDNRASILGALGALGWLAFSRARRFVLVQAGVLVAALTVVTGMALLTEHPWAEKKLHGVVERVVSMGDVVGRGTYVSEESAMKGDNNRFRSLWWRTVVDETLTQSPVFGLGFGYDLARGFLQEYNPEIEDFSARSPHSIAVSVFGRMGALGLAVFVLFLLTLAVRTWRIMRQPETEAAQLGLWASVWVILISACFGVVLEGPMGAVVFWSLLGLANAMLLDPTPADPAPDAADAPRLPQAAPADELAPAP